MKISENRVNRAINTNSLNGNLFPVCIEFAKVNDIYRIYLMPISVLEIMDLIPFNTFLVFNVDANEYENFNPVSLKTLTKKYSTYVNSFDDQTLLISKEDIIQLLNEISHYNFCLIDAKKEIELNKVIQIIDLADKLNDITMIKEVDANIFLSSHDDCYLYLETNDENLALELIGLQIKILIEAATHCSVSEVEFNPKKLITKDESSIVIPQNPTKKDEQTTWKILEGTFKDFVYSKEMNKSEFELVLDEQKNSIKIEKVRSLSTSD